MFRASRQLFATAAAVLPGLLAGASAAPPAAWREHVSADLQQVYASAGSANAHLPQPGARFDARGRVQVAVRLDCGASGAATQLAAAGVSLSTRVRIPPYCLAEGWVAPAALPAAAAVSGVRQITVPAYAIRHPLHVAPAALNGQPQTGGGGIDAVGVSLMRADQYRVQTRVNGSGVTVGVISDDATSLALIQSRGELPPGVLDLSAVGTSNPVPTDEGTMMLEEVHAVAPGAGLLFCGALTYGEYLGCLSSLSGAGATVLVDDLLFSGSGLDLMSASSGQPVQTLLAQSPTVALFTSAGNDQGSYWQDTYQPVSLQSIGSTSLTCAANGQTDYYIESFGGNYGDVLAVGASGSYPLMFAWADPYDQNVSNFDLYLFDATTGTSTCYPAAGSGGSTPLATLIFATPALAASDQYGLFIGTPDASLSGKLLKLALIGDGATQLAQYSGGALTSPQAFVTGVAAIGAVDGSDGIGDTIEPYSDVGPLTLQFPAPAQLQAPALVAPDAITVDAAGTQFAGSLIGGYFRGTSAAAPNAAAIATLLRSAFPSLTPAQLNSALQSGATPLGSGVPNATFGYGRVDALGALGTLPVPTISALAGTSIVGGSSSAGQSVAVTGVAPLHFVIQSSNAGLVPAALATVGHAGVQVSPSSCGAGTSSCTIAFTPALGQTGTTQLTVTVLDGANRSASAHATVTVTKPAAPTVSIITDGTQSLTEGGSAAPVGFSVKGTGALTISATSNNPTLLPQSSLSVTSGCGATSTNCTLKVAVAPDQSGSGTVTVRAADAYGQSASANASVEVSAASGGGGGALDLALLLGLSAAALQRARRCYGTI